MIRYSSLLDPAAGVIIDISPGSLGANSLGTNDGSGHEVNPSTGLLYEPNLVNQADFARALAEFWADGPRSETPPGHWNTLANSASDALDPELRIGGGGGGVDRLGGGGEAVLGPDGRHPPPPRGPSRPLARPPAGPRPGRGYHRRDHRPGAAP